MSKLMKSFLVSVLVVSMMVMGPLSAIAITPPTEDAAVILKPYDLTDALSSAATSAGFNGAREVTSIAVCPGQYYFVAAVDNDGLPFILESDGDSVSDYFPATMAEGFTHITDMAVVVTGASGPYVSDTPVEGESVYPNYPALAITGDIGGYAYLRIVDISMNYVDIDLSAFDITEVTSVAGDFLSTGVPIGMTVNGTGFAMFDWTTVEVADSAPMNGAANVVEIFMGMVFVAGSHDGRLLFLGPGSGEIFLPEGAGEVESLSFDLTGPDSNILAASIGNSGYARLFSVADADNILETSVPQTMTSNVYVSSGPNSVLVAGTGNESSHLYKWKPAAGQFIDLDYMVSGMDQVNDLYSQYGFYLPNADLLQPLTDRLSNAFSGIAAQTVATPAGDPVWMVGGVGAKKLVTVYEAEPMDLTPVEAGQETTAECDAGGASVEIPAGAVSVGYNVLVEKVASGTPAVPSGLSLLGTSYDFTCFDTDGNLITTFDAPVTITISYDEADLNGMSEDSLVIYWYNTETAAWEAIVPSVVDKVNNTVTIQVSHFSQFGILGATATAMPYTGI